MHPLPCSSSFAKSHARLACSVASALTTARCRYQLLARCRPAGGVFRHRKNIGFNRSLQRRVAADKSRTSRRWGAVSFASAPKRVSVFLCFQPDGAMPPSFAFSPIASVDFVNALATDPLRRRPQGKIHKPVFSARAGNR